MLDWCAIQKKCYFGKPSLRFLGHIITAEGILPVQEHINTVLRAPPPSDAALWSFLGLVSWDIKFLPNFATAVAPMHECASDNDSFKWTPAAQASFEEVKQLLVNNPALALFDPSLRPLIATDASDYELGAVFAQVKPDGTEKPVAFTSHTLTETEQKYSIVDKEALACVWAVEKWRTYLWGRRFTLHTDHQALTTLLKRDRLNWNACSPLHACSALIMTYYRPGSQNYIADCLSCLAHVL